MDDHAPDLFAADYALGTLDGAGIARARARMESDPAFRSEVDAWQRTLACLPPAAEAEPPPCALGRIEAAIDGLAVAPGTRTVRAEDGVWVPALPGVACKFLHTDPDGRGLSYLVRMEPGAMVPSHSHDALEECLMIVGEISVGGLVLKAGDYHVAPAGVVHPDLVAPQGALFLIRRRADVGAD